QATLLYLPRSMAKMVLVDAVCGIVFILQAPPGGCGVCSRGSLQTTTPPRLAWILSAAEVTVLFDAFWRATGEPAFDALAASCAECYRLSIETSLAPQHRVYRMQRSAGEVSRFVAHFFVFGASRDEATARTHEMKLEEPLWSAFDALLAAARFWDLPAENGRCAFHSSPYSLYASKT